MDDEMGDHRIEGNIGRGSEERFTAVEEQEKC